MRQRDEERTRQSLTLAERASEQSPRSYSLRTTCERLPRAIVARAAPAPVERQQRLADCSYPCKQQSTEVLTALPFAPTTDVAARLAGECRYARNRNRRTLPPSRRAASPKRFGRGMRQTRL